MDMQFVQGKLQLNDDLYSHNQHGKRSKYFPDRQYFVNDPGINLQTFAALSISANIFTVAVNLNIPKVYAATLK